MYRFFIQKFAEMLLTLLVLSMLAFAGVHATGDPARVLATDDPRVSEELFLELKKKWGLADPLPIQYLRFLRNLVTSFDFGRSLIHQRPVRDMVLERVPYTLQLAGAGMFLTIIIGVPLGVLAALKRNSVFDRSARLFAVVSMAAPGFWLAIMLILLFAAILRWLPAYGVGSPQHLILPAVAVALAGIAGIMRLTRSSMLEVLESDYIKFARIKGLRERLVIWKHALRTASVPLLTFGGLSLAGLLNGSIVVEVVFAWPGLGRLMVEAVVLRNVPMVVATTLVSAFLFIATAFVVDVLYAYTDPRIRYR